MNSELKNSKKNLVIQFNVQEIFKEPNKEYLEEEWQKITSNFINILKEGKSQLVFQELYNNINDLLFYEVSTTTKVFIENILVNYASEIKIKLDEIMNEDKEKFFDNFNNIWFNVVKNFNVLRKITNRYEKKIYGNIQKNNVYAIFLDSLKEGLKRNNNLKTLNSMIQITNENINNFRKKIIHKEITFEKGKIEEFLSKIKLVINFLSESGLYKEYFNKSFLDDSKKFYDENTKKIIQDKNLEDYISYVDLVFSLEKTLILDYLNEISLKSLENELNTILLKDKSKIIFDKFFFQNKKEIFSENFPLMKKIFLLFKGIKIEDEIKKRFNDYIQKCSEKIYDLYNSNYFELYNKLILLKTNVNNFVSISFLNEEKFKSLSKESLTKALNKKPNFITDIFSRYIDYVLTVLAKKEKIDKLKERIDEFIILFKLIENKDMFEHFFIKRLANTCLYNLNISEELQNYLIEQLKYECGNFFVSKSQEMISDVKLSEELNTLFNSNNQNLQKQKIKYNFYVYSNYSWPIDTIISGNINNDISFMQKEFYNFYKNKNSGKTLKWHLPYCSSEIEFLSNDKKNYLIKGNGIHTIILLNFKKNKLNLSLNDLVKLTKLDKDILKLNLDDITNIKLLNYDSNKKIYSLNLNFKNSNKEINLIHVNTENTSIKENEKIEKKTNEDRKPVIDCYLMKVLKQKKVMNRNDLIEEVLKKLPFQSDKEFVIKRLEQLISSKYISPDEKDNNLVKYC